MKMVVAVIRPEKVDDVVDALEAVNVPGVTITDVRGRGEQGGICLQYRAGKMQIHTAVPCRQDADSYPAQNKAGDRGPRQRC